MRIPVINIHPLIVGTNERNEVAQEIGRACRECGFFYVTGHGIDEDLQHRLEQMSRQFFAQDLHTKLEISMARGGRAWRGYFPVGAELTSGEPDLKEGIYFGSELDADDPLVQERTPLHGPNIFPSNLPGFREIALRYMASMTRLGHSLIAGISLSLGLDESYFHHRYTFDPLILFRIFNYPPPSNASGPGVGEHTDYGLLTILRQDMSGGLQIKVKSEWIDADPIPNSFVCNIGDMLDRVTGGYYLSAPHRVMNPTQRNRLSFAFFFDPNFNARVEPLRVGAEVSDDKENRWDRSSVHEFRGTYGDYLLKKVSKVFPDLHGDVI